MILSFVPSMFQVSSYLLYDFDDIFNKNQYWRIFTGIFACNHPDTLILEVFLLFYSRDYEYKKGILHYVLIFILALIFGCGPYLLLGINQNKFGYFYGDFILEYTLILPVAMGVISLINLSGSYLQLTKQKKFSSKYGIILILILCLTHRLCAASAIASAWGIIVGLIIGLIDKQCLIEYIDSLLRYDKQNYSSEFIKENPIPDVDNEKPTTKDLKERIQQIQNFKAPNLQDISYLTKTEINEQKQLTLSQVEKILTQIFHNQLYQMFYLYPDQEKLINYESNIPYPMCFCMILARFYQNLQKKQDFQIINQNDYIEKPEVEPYLQIKQYLQDNKKILYSEQVRQYITTQSLENSYNKIFANFKYDYIQPYIYFDQLLADLIQIGINCCYYNKQSTQIKNIGIQLIKEVKSTLGQYDYPSYYQFKLKNYSDEEISAIIQGQQELRSKSRSALQTSQFESTIMAQLKDTEMITSTIINPQAQSAIKQDEMLIKTEQKQNEVVFEDGKHPGDQEIKITDLTTTKDELIEKINELAENIGDSVLDDDDQFMEMTQYRDYDKLQENQLKETVQYLESKYNEN